MSIVKRTVFTSLNDEELMRVAETIIWELESKGGSLRDARLINEIKSRLSKQRARNMSLNLALSRARQILGDVCT